VADQPDSAHAPSDLIWRDEKLYFQAWQERLRPSLVVMPDTGGAADELSSDTGNGLWNEGDLLLYSRADRLYSVPITGGSSMLVSDGGMFGAAPPSRSGTTSCS